MLLLAWSAATVAQRRAALALSLLQYSALYHGGSGLLNDLYIDELYYTKASFRISTTGAESNLPAVLC